MAEKYKIVYSNALGWRVQADIIRQIALGEARNIQLEFIPYSTPRFCRLALKDTYGAGVPRRLNLISSISIAQSRLCRNTVKFGANDKVVFLGGNSLGLLAHASSDIDAVVVTDVTSAMAISLFQAKFSSKDVLQEKRLLVRCKKIFPMSKACYDSLLYDYCIDPDRIEMYLPPVYGNFVAPTKPRFKPAIGFIGGDFYRKGGHLLLEAYKQLGLKDRCDLIIVSEMCPKLSEPGVTVYGKLPHDTIVKSILPSLDVFCLPTTQDCSGLAIAEALAAGVPVITTQLPGIADLVVNGRNGLVVAPNSVDAVAEAINKLLLNETYRTGLSNRARQYAVENFNAERKLHRLIEVLSQ